MLKKMFGDPEKELLTVVQSSLNNLSGTSDTISEVENTNDLIIGILDNKEVFLDRFKEKGFYVSQSWTVKGYTDEEYLGDIVLFLMYDKIPKAAIILLIKALSEGKINNDQVQYLNTQLESEKKDV